MKNTIDLRGMKRQYMYRRYENTRYSISRLETLALTTLLLGAAISANLWIDSGCPAPLHTGIITTAGKECLQ